MNPIKLTMLSMIMMTMPLAGCNQQTKPEEKTNYTIGILQPVEHGALSAAREGFMEAINKAGINKQINFVYRNASGKDAQVVSFAKDLVSTSDMTLGIGTGASKALREAQVDKGLEKPVLFTAVTDPVDAGLVKSMENTTGFVTGTSDAQPIDAQIGVIKEVKADADKVGILYTASESNSVIQANQAEAAISALGMSAIRKTCTGPSDISAVALALASEPGIDAIYVPTDNNIAANTDAVKNAVRNKKILVVTGEEDMLKGCGHLTLSINYHDLGYRTGEMAVSIIKGEKYPRQIPVETMSKEQCNWVKCTPNMNDAGFVSGDIPAEILEKCSEVELA